MLDTEIERATAAERITQILNAYLTPEYLEQFNLDEEDDIINRGVTSG